MKMVAFNGSPAGHESSTNVIGEALLRGAKQAGAETENVFLIEQNIGYCKGCFSCWFQNPGSCAMADDMTKLLELYESADVVCFASPVYTWNVTATLKNFVDRLIPLKNPQIVSTEGNFDLEDLKPRTQKFVVISNCGFPGENNFETMKAVFAPCKPVLEIYRNCGKLLRSKDEKVRKIVQKYVNVVEQAGIELVKNGELSKETEEKLQLPLMSVQDYVRYIGM